jgi:hypothetical protein
MLNQQSNQPHSFSAVFKGAFILILFAFSIASNAQTFSSTSPYRADEQAMIVSEQQAYRPYQSTVYEPFGSATPSQIAGRRNTNGYEGDVNLDGWEDPDIAEPGDTSTESPIGEPWVMLIFAAAAAVVVAIRGKKQGLSKG